MTRRNRDTLVSGSIAVVSVVSLIWVIPTYTPAYPGYGVSAALLPNVVVGIILLLSLLSLGYNIYAHAKEGPAEDIPEDDKVHLWYLVKFMLPCLLFFPAIKWVGYIPSALIFMLLIQFICGQRKPVTMLLVAVCSVAVMYAAMRYGLKIPMP